MRNVLEESAITNFMQQKSTRYQLRHWVLFCSKILFSSEFVTALSQIHAYNLWKWLIYCISAKYISSVFSLQTNVRLFCLTLCSFNSILLPDKLLISIRKVNGHILNLHKLHLSYFLFLILIEYSQQMEYFFTVRHRTAFLHFQTLLVCVPSHLKENTNIITDNFSS